MIAQSVGSDLSEFGAPSLARLEALSDPNDWRVVEARRGRRALYAADDREPPAGRLPRAVAGRGTAIPGSAAHRAERAGDARRLRRSESRRSASSTRRASGSTRRIPGASTAGGETRMVRARREVILAGGAFNTPQLLMLSGIGDPDVAEQVRDHDARAAPRRGPQSAGSLRSAGRQSDAAAVGDARGRDVHDRATRNIAPGRPAARASTRPTARSSVSCSARRSASQCPICSATPCSPTSAATSPATRRSIRKRHDCLTWIVLKGAHQQPRRVGGDHVARSARAAGDRLPLFRGRHRCRRRRPAGGGRGHQAGAAADRRA